MIDFSLYDQSVLQGDTCPHSTCALGCRHSLLQGVLLGSPLVIISLPFANLRGSGFFMHTFSVECMARKMWNPHVRFV